MQLDFTAVPSGGFRGECHFAINEWIQAGLCTVRPVVGLRPFILFFKLVSEVPISVDLKALFDPHHVPSRIGPKCASYNDPAATIKLYSVLKFWLLFCVHR